MSPDVISILVYLVFLVFLIIQGLRKEARFASWRMFTSGSRAYFNLVNQKTGDRISEWDFIPHSQIQMTYSGVKLFLEYLSFIGLKAAGEVTVVERRLTAFCQIKNSQVTKIEVKKTRD